MMQPRLLIVYIVTRRRIYDETIKSNIIIIVITPTAETGKILLCRYRRNLHDTVYGLFSGVSRRNVDVV